VKQWQVRDIYKLCRARTDANDQGKDGSGLSLLLLSPPSSCSSSRTDD